MSPQLKRIQAAVIDGRAQTPRFIQKQLTKLHEALVKHSADFKNAIKNDSNLLDVEAEVEYFLTLDAVRQAYSSVDFSKALANEYSLAASKDHSSRRVAHGCAFVVPSQNSPFYSTIVPMVIAIAAGNCVILEVSNCSLSGMSILKMIAATKSLTPACCSEDGLDGFSGQGYFLHL